MKTLKVLAALLTYPEAEWIAALDELEQVVIQERGENGMAALPLAELFEMLRKENLITLQQIYVATFDQNPSHSLHLFEHIHGESRDRGPAMVNLMEEYTKQGLEISASELPDYVPLFLEYLSMLPDADALAMLGDAVHVLALIGNKLEKNGSPYHGVFKVLEKISPVIAQDLPQPPIRDMDEALVTFGPSLDGVEPLLTPKVAYASMPKSRRNPELAGKAV